MSLSSCSGWLNVSFPLSTQNREEELKIQKYGNHLFVKSVRHKLDTQRQKYSATRILTKKSHPVTAAMLVMEDLLKRRSFSLNLRFLLSVPMFAFVAVR